MQRQLLIIGRSQVSGHKWSWTDKWGLDWMLSISLFLYLLGSRAAEREQRVSQRVLSKGVAWLENFLFFLKITSGNLQVLLECTHLRAGGSLGEHRDSVLRH